MKSTLMALSLSMGIISCKAHTLENPLDQNLKNSSQKSSELIPTKNTTETMAMDPNDNFSCFSGAYVSQIDDINKMITCTYKNMENISESKASMSQSTLSCVGQGSVFNSLQSDKDNKIVGGTCVQIPISGNETQVNTDLNRLSCPENSFVMSISFDSSGAANGITCGTLSNMNFELASTSSTTTTNTTVDALSLIHNASRVDLVHKANFGLYFRVFADSNLVANLKQTPISIGRQFYLYDLTGSKVIKAQEKVLKLINNLSFYRYKYTHTLPPKKQNSDSAKNYTPAGYIQAPYAMNFITYMNFFDKDSNYIGHVDRIAITWMPEYDVISPIDKETDYKITSSVKFPFYQYHIEKLRASTKIPMEDVIFALSYIVSRPKSTR